MGNEISQPAVTGKRRYTKEPITDPVISVPIGDDGGVYIGESITTDGSDDTDATIPKSVYDNDGIMNGKIITNGSELIQKVKLCDLARMYTGRKTEVGAENRDENVGKEISLDACNNRMDSALESGKRQEQDIVTEKIDVKLAKPDIVTQCEQECEKRVILNPNGVLTQPVPPPRTSRLMKRNNNNKIKFPIDINEFELRGRKYVKPKDISGKDQCTGTSDMKDSKEENNCSENSTENIAKQENISDQVQESRTLENSSEQEPTSCSLLDEIHTHLDTAQSTELSSVDTNTQEKETDSTHSQDSIVEFEVKVSVANLNHEGSVTNSNRKEHIAKIDEKESDSDITPTDNASDVNSERTTLLNQNDCTSDQVSEDRVTDLDEKVCFTNRDQENLVSVTGHTVSVSEFDQHVTDKNVGITEEFQADCCVMDLEQKECVTDLEKRVSDSEHNEMITDLDNDTTQELHEVKPLRIMALEKVHSQNNMVIDNGSNATKISVINEENKICVDIIPQEIVKDSKISTVNHDIDKTGEKKCKVKYSTFSRKVAAIWAEYGHAEKTETEKQVIPTENEKPPKVKKSNSFWKYLTYHETPKKTKERQRQAKKEKGTLSSGSSGGMVQKETAKTNNSEPPSPDFAQHSPVFDKNKSCNDGEEEKRKLSSSSDVDMVQKETATINNSEPPSPDFVPHSPVLDNNERESEKKQYEPGIAVVDTKCIQNTQQEAMIDEGQCEIKHNSESKTDVEMIQEFSAREERDIIKKSSMSKVTNQNSEVNNTTVSEVVPASVEIPSQLQDTSDKDVSVVKGTGDSVVMRRLTSDHKESVTSSQKGNGKHRKTNKRSNSISAKISDFFMQDFGKRSSSTSTKTEGRKKSPPAQKQRKNSSNGSGHSSSIERSFPEDITDLDHHKTKPERLSGFPKFLSISNMNLSSAKEKSQKTKKRRRSSSNLDIAGIGVNDIKSEDEPRQRPKSIFDDDIAFSTEEEKGDVISLSSLSDENDDGPQTKAQVHATDDKVLVNETKTKASTAHVTSVACEVVTYPTVVRNEHIESDESEVKEPHVGAYVHLRFDKDTTDNDPLPESAKSDVNSSLDSSHIHDSVDDDNETPKQSLTLDDSADKSGSECPSVSSPVYSIISNGEETRQDADGSGETGTDKTNRSNADQTTNKDEESKKLGTDDNGAIDTDNTKRDNSDQPTNTDDDSSEQKLETEDTGETDTDDTKRDNSGQHTSTDDVSSEQVQETNSETTSCSYEYVSSPKVCGDGEKTRSSDIVAPSSIQLDATVAGEDPKQSPVESEIHRAHSLQELQIQPNIYDEIESKRPIIYRRHSERDECNVIRTLPDGTQTDKRGKKKKRSLSFSDFFKRANKAKGSHGRPKKKSKEHTRRSPVHETHKPIPSTSSSIVHM